MVGALCRFWVSEILVKGVQRPAVYARNLLGRKQLEPLTGVLLLVPLKQAAFRLGFQGGFASRQVLHHRDLSSELGSWSSPNWSL